MHAWPFWSSIQLPCRHADKPECLGEDSRLLENTLPATLPFMDHG